MGNEFVGEQTCACGLVRLMLVSVLRECINAYTLNYSGQSGGADASVSLTRVRIHATGHV